MSETTEVTDDTVEAPTEPLGATQDAVAVVAAPEPPVPLAAEIVPVARHPETGLVTFTTRQVEVLRSVVGSSLSDDEMDYFLAQCKRLELDPFSGQIYAWKDKGRVVTMTSIDGLRVVRDRTGKFTGQVGPMWCGPDGEWEVDQFGDPKPWLHKERPAAARVGIFHAEHGNRPTWGIATFDAYGRKTGFWQTVGGSAHMLGKVAEAIALRAAFPNDMSGVFTDDEIPESKPEPGSSKQPLPGVGDLKVEAVMSKFRALPDEARAKIDAWWTGPYQAKFMTTRQSVPSVSDGGLYEFRGGSPHVGKIGELVDKAVEATGVDPFLDTSAPTSAPTETPEPETPTAAPTTDEASQGETEPLGPQLEDEWTLEERIITALEGGASMTMAEMGEALNLEDTQSLRRPVQRMWQHGDLELDTDTKFARALKVNVYRIPKELL